MAVPNTFSASTKILAAEVNENFEDLDDRLSAIEGIAFSAYGSTGSSSANPIAAGSVRTVIMCDTEELDSGAAYNTATARWTPQIAGWYMVGGIIHLLDSLETGTGIFGRIDKNGVEMGYLSSSGSPQGAMGMVPVELDGDNDYVELVGLQTGVATKRWAPPSGGSPRTRFYGYLIHAS